MKLAGVFGDHMVVQRNIPLPVWGWAEAGESVAVELAGRNAETTADAQGAWQVRLPALEAGGPHELKVTGARETLVLRDVMAGEVWLCSGQSNMGVTVTGANNPHVELQAADHPGIRLFTVPQVATLKRRADARANWLRCSRESVGSFSAVGYFFGRELQRRLGVPVGLINSSWGGTIAEAWTSREGLLAVSSLKAIAEDFDAMLETTGDVQAAYQKALAEWTTRTLTADPGSQTGVAKGWAATTFDAAAWPAMDLPCYWQSAGLKFSGVLWFRKEIVLPAVWAGKDLRLSLGACDKSDDTFFNNERVGGLSIDERADVWCQPRQYTIPGRLVKAGRNVIAVRVFSNIYSGGFSGARSEMNLAATGVAGTKPLSLAGSWRYHVEHNFGLVQVSPPVPPLGEGNPHSPTSLFNGMIAPLVPHGIRGAIWYQGESNAGRPEQYRDLFPALIRDWRRQWRNDAMAFHFVQLANYTERKPDPTDSNWAMLREAQTMALSLPHTGMAVAIDIGEANDIHPKNKQDVGLRLAFNALSKTYGMKDVTPCGPLYSGMTVEGSTIRVRFKHAESGLVAKGGGNPTGFAIAGEDRRFEWAVAVIEKDTVRVSSPGVPKPVAVRYAWADNPACNLTNDTGLPAAPFRTDNWPRPGQ